MSAIEIRPVVTAADRRTFLTFPWRIYRGDPLWVPPLLPERKKVIDPRQGAFFKHGQAEFFIAWRSGQPVGTICAAEDWTGNKKSGNQECLFGFFDCVEDEQVARALFDHVKSWAARHQLKSLHGPMNLDYEDSYGVLLEGRDRPPVLLCGHTPTYYQGFFERYGFQPARGDNLAYAVDVRQDTPALQQLSRLAERVRQRRQFTIRTADLSQWDAEVDRVHLLMNKGLSHLPDYIPYERVTVEAMVGPFRSLADPALVLFAEAGGQTVGFFPGLANYNEVLQHVNGLRYPWDYLRLAWYMRRKPKCLTIKSVLVLPEYWGSGIAILLFDEMVSRIRAKGFEWVDLSLTSDDNPKTPELAERLGGNIYKRYRVYRLFL